MIKVKPRAVVTEAFKNAYVALAAERLENLQEELKYYRPEMQRQMAKKYEAMIRRLKPIADRKQGAMVGLDLEVSRLRAMDFVKFDAVMRLDKPWLMGYTRDVKMVCLGKKSEWWDIGPYEIAVPFNDILPGRMDGIHLVPLRNPEVRMRHTHHVCYHGQQFDETRDPLSLRPGWCWSSFAEPIRATLTELDLIELFRTLHIFLQRYNSGSPLARPERGMPHAWYLGVEPPEVP